MTTLAFRRLSHAGANYFVLLHTSAVPDAAEWRAYLAEVASVLALGGPLTHVFVATDGGGPDALQRKDLAEVIARGPGDLLTHVFTMSAFVRGVVTAFRWIARASATAHVPTDFSAVCRTSGLPPHDVFRAMLATQETFVRVQIVYLIEQTLATPPRRRMSMR